MDKQNVNISIPKDILKKAKHIAVDRQTSLSSLLADLINWKKLFIRKMRTTSQKTDNWTPWQKGLTWDYKIKQPEEGKSYMTETNELQFVDTNIFVYAYNTSDKTKHQYALNLVTRLWHTGTRCLSIQVLQELYVTFTLKVPHPLTPEACTPIIEDLGQWRLHRPGLKSILKAVQIQQQYNITFWDAMIICSAIELGCKQIWTEDLNNAQSYSGVTAVNPFLI